MSGCNRELVDLSDLRTESSYVRGKLAAYLNDLISLGVDGFRLDAAKHIPVADLQATLAQVNGNPYIYSEVIEGGPGEISPTEYTGISDVTEFRYGDVVGNAFRDGNLANLTNLAGSMLLGRGDAIAFVDNHDTQRNGRARLTYKDGTPYALAEAFMLAWPYGAPQVMSSFTFALPDQGPPANGSGLTNAVNCGSGWVREHQWRTTANLVGLRNAAAGAGVTNWWSNGGNQIAFGRGSAGYVVFNRGGGLTRTFQTNLPGGTYCDVANGDFSGVSCTGAAYTVDSNGQFTATVTGDSMLALHVNARTTDGSCTAVSVTAEVNASTVWGQNIYDAGSIPALEHWNTGNAIPLSSAAYPVRRATVSLPRGPAVQYKYIKKDASGHVIGEGDELVPIFVEVEWRSPT
jgi:alpha-amylase